MIGVSESHNYDTDVYGGDDNDKVDDNARSTIYLKSVSERSFSSIFPSVWNSLPARVRSLPILSNFKTQLKDFPVSTYLSTNVGGRYVCVYVLLYV